MGIANCPTCNALFNKTTFRLVCDACFREEEAQFEKVYQYIRKRVNRTATMAQVVEATEVEEGLIIRYVKSGKLRLAQFPNLGIPCEQCGQPINEGRLCKKCTENFSKELQTFEKEEERRLEMIDRSTKSTYYTKDIKKQQE